MPIYEYECKSCGARFDELMPCDAEAPECPKCKSHDVERLISACFSKMGYGKTYDFGGEAPKVPSTCPSFGGCGTGGGGGGIS